MTKRVAIYARFSSERQNERSCQDQTDLCAAWAERQGFIVVERYSDAAVSGASTINRFGLASLMRDAKAKRFDIVIAEALDRISRDQADLAQIRKELNFLEIGIMTVQDGEVGAMHIGLKGLMGEMYLADLAQKTRRGLNARVVSGGTGGGKSYGYDTVPGRPGELIINPREAAIVKRVFDEYVAGNTPRQIVARLNSEGVPGPRGGKWNASTINGSRIRQNGLVNNRLYAGEIIWNRQRFVKDPATGKRISRLNPESEWVIAPAPHLAIIEADTFAAALASKTRKGAQLAVYSRKPKHLLTGLIKCGCCGASYTILGKDRLGCSGYRERGDCTNGRTVERLHIEGRVLDAIKTRLTDPEFVAEYVRTYHEERRRLASSNRADRSKHERRLAELTSGIERIVDKIVDGTAPDALVARMAGMEAERRQLTAMLGSLAEEENTLRVHPAAAEKYRRIIITLQDHIAGIAKGAPAEALILEARKLISSIVVIAPQNSKEPVDLTVHGLLADLLLASSGSYPMKGNAGCGDTQQPIPCIVFAA